MSASDDLLDQAARLRGGTSPMDAPLGSTRASEGLLDDVVGEQKRRSAVVLDMVSPVNPDKAAEAKALAQRFQLSVDTVEQRQDDYSRLARVQDAQQLLESSPILRRQLTDPDFARLAHDDLGNLGQMEATIGPIRGPRANTWTVARGLVNALPQGAELARQGLRQQFADFFGFKAMSEDAARKRSQADLERQVMTPEIEGDTARGVYGGVSSFARMLPGLAASIATRSTAPMLTTMGVQTEAEAYGKYRARGATPGEALVGGVGEGAVEVATEMLPMGFLVQNLGRMGAGRFLTGMLAREIPTEQAATLAQDAIDTAIANPNKTWGEYVAERPGAAYQTLIATITQTALTGGVHVAVGRIQGRSQDAQRSAEVGEALLQLNELAAASRVRERDSGTAQTFLQSLMDEGRESVWITPQALLDSGLAEQMAQVIPAVAEQLQAAQGTGAEIRIPIAELMATMAGPEIAQSVLPHLADEPGGFTPTTAAEYMQSGAAQELETEVAREVGAKKDDDAFNASRDAVTGQVLAQLNTANRFTPDVNSAYASMVGNFYAVQAAKLGITPEEMAQRYPLQVRAERLAGAKTLDQDENPTRLQRPNEAGRWSGETMARWNTPWAAIKRLAQDGKVTAADAAAVKKLGADESTAPAALAKLVKEIKARPVATLNQDQPSPRGSISLGDDITQTPSVITLLAKADLSTFLHESGHFFLEVMNDMASRPDAPASVVEDMAAVLKWFGVPDLATWDAYDIEQKRVYHEQFARGFEAYLFEGNAPNAGMQGLFSRFRAWMLNVYKSLTALNVELNDEVRAVFDRMLATTEAIAEAEREANLGGMFETKPDFMTDEEYQAYQSLALDATNDAIHNLESRSLRDMRWLTNAKARLLAKMQAEAREKRKSVRAEVEAEVMAEPVNRVQTFLKRGTVDGQEVEGGFKLSIAEIEDMYKDNPAIGSIKDALGYGKYGMLGTENGIHPDQVAEQFGFTSGDEMIRAILAAENAQEKIEGITDQRMLERYGDLTDERAISQAVDAALVRDMRTRVLATELNALNKAIGARPVLAKAAKAYAEAAIARLKVRDLRPDLYTAAARRAAKASEKAFAAGDLRTAAMEKQNQLVNTYAARAATAAREEVGKSVDYFNKLNREGARKSLDDGYLEQIDRILERFDMRKGQSLRAIDKRTSLAKWMEAQEQEGFEPNIPPWLKDEALRKSFKDMTVEEVRGLRDTIEQIVHLARLKHKLLTAKDERELQAIVDEITASIEENSGGRVVDNEVRNTAPSRVAHLFRGALAAHRKASFVVRQMDGHKDAGPLWNYLIRSMNEAGDREAGMRSDAALALYKLAQPILAGAKMGGKGTFFPSVGRPFNRGERLAIALNWGNASNRQRLLGGKGWTEEQLQPVLDSLTTADWTFVQGVWDFFEAYRPQIGAKEKRVYGKEPDWIEATPLNVTTADGQQVALRGGYYPIKYDPRQSGRAGEHADAEEAKAMMRAAYTAATTRRSFTKGRAEEVHGRPLLLTFDGIWQGANEVIHDLAWHEWLIDASRLMRKLDAPMRKHYGDEAVNVLKKSVRDTARGDVAAANAMERSLQHLRTGATVAGLGWNLTTAMLQPIGITQSFVRIGPKWVARGLRAFYGNPFQMMEVAAEVQEKSEFMRNRARTMSREINDVQNQLNVGKGPIRTAVEGSFFILIQKLQATVDYPTWLGGYEKAIAAGHDEGKAIALADQAVIESQGGGQIKDLAEVQRGHPAWKLFTNFYSYFSVTLNNAIDRTTATDFTKPAEVGRLAGDYLLLMVVPALLSTFVRAALKGDDDEEELVKKAAQDQIAFMLGMFVGLREVTGAVQVVAGVGTPFGYAGPAGLRFFAEMHKLGQQVNQGEADMAAFKAANNVAGVLFHYPSGQVNRTVEGAAALLDGRTKNPMAPIVGPIPKR